MATILGRKTWNATQILEVDADPSAGAGTPGPLGSLALAEDGTGPYVKTGATDVDWAAVGTGAAGGRLRSDTVVYFTTPSGLSVNPTPDTILIIMDTVAGAPIDVKLPLISTLQPGQMIGVYLPVGNPNSVMNLTPGGASDQVLDFQGNGPSPGVALSFPIGTFSGGDLIAWEGVNALAGGVPFNAWVPRFDRTGITPNWDTVLTQGNTASVADPTLVEPTRLVLGAQSMDGGVIRSEVISTTRTAEWTTDGSGSFQTIGAPLLNASGKVRDYILFRIFGQGGFQPGGVGSIFSQHLVVEEQWSNGALTAVLRREGLGGISPGLEGETRIFFDSGTLNYYLQIRESSSAGSRHFVVARVEIEELWELVV